MRTLSLIALTAFSNGLVQAEVVNIPQESGFSGFVIGGAGYTRYETNLFKGPGDGNKLHDGLLNSPADNSETHVIGGVDLRYTLAEMRTQLFLGNLIQDAIRFDFTQQLGVRQAVGEQGVMALSYVYNAKDAQTWADPYKAGKREGVDMDTQGVRLAWDQVAGSRFNVAYTYRERELDRETSGEGLGLTPEQTQLLDRNGELHQFNLSYDWIMDARQVVRPEFVFAQGDMDGEASSFDRYQAKLTYAVKHQRWSATASAFVGSTRYDQDNPIYSKAADSNEYGLGASFYWHRLMGVTGLNALVSAAIMESDSDISFHDASVRHLSTGLLYRF